MDVLKGRSFQDVMSLYEGRTLPQEQQVDIERLPIKDKEALKARICESTKRASEVYKSIKSSGDPEMTEIEPNSIIRSEAVLISSELVDEDVPLTLVCMKFFKYEVNSREEPDDSFQVVLARGDYRNYTLKEMRANSISSKGADLVAEMIIKNVGKNFRIPHRFVSPEFRRQKFGDMILGGMEEFVKQESTENQKSTALVLDAGQLDLIFWLLNNGFVPDGKEEEEKLNRILDGDPSLCIGKKYNIFPNTVPEESRVHSNSEDKFYVRFIKKIEPDESKEVAGVVEKTQKAVNEL
ncbi:hypothetical protein M0P48_03290 [Candidatus Gracilibacteria bacterium]|nr:hypothetical protein [Candidatus Gracilibacteria bacterium]